MNQNTYFGGKSGSGTYQTIINQVTPHRLWVEGFAGKAGIFRKKLAAKENLLIDLDREVIHWMIKSGISTTDVYEGSCFQVLKDYPRELDKDDVFIYLDPPYPLASRKSATKYKFELTDQQHIDLLALANGYESAKIAITTYPNEIYSRILGNNKRWRLIEFESQTRGGKATEQLWMNYPEPDSLHDYQYLGADYREREIITRKQRRWEEKFKSLSNLEKLAMLQRLSAALTVDPVLPPATVEYTFEFQSLVILPKPVELDLSEAVTVYATGMSLAELAIYYGVSENKLYNELRRKGLFKGIQRINEERRISKINI